MSPEWIWRRITRWGSWWTSSAPPVSTGLAMPSDETGNLARWYCPTCEPQADPVAEVLQVQWCDTHRPVTVGVDDPLVETHSYLSGSAEAGGEENRQFCGVIHRSTST